MRVALFSAAALGVYLVVVFGGMEVIRRLTFPYVYARPPHVTTPAAALGVGLPAMWFFGRPSPRPAGLRVFLAGLTAVPSLLLFLWLARAANALLDPEPGRWFEYRVAGYAGRGDSHVLLRAPPGGDAPPLDVARPEFEREREVGAPAWALVRPGFFRAAWLARYQYTPPAR